MRVGENRRGRLVDEVVRVRGKRRKVLAQRHLIWDLFWVGRRLFAFTESRSGRSSLLEVTRGDRRSVALTGERVGAVAVSGHRRVAYSFGGRQRHRIAVMRLDGTHRRVFRRDWVPWTWSPDGRRILVGESSRIGLMNPRTGRVRRLGRCPADTSAQPSGRGPVRTPEPRQMAGSACGTLEARRDRGHTKDA